jgi:HK97 family phage major capsid protein
MPDPTELHGLRNRTDATAARHRDGLNVGRYLKSLAVARGDQLAAAAFAQAQYDQHRWDATPALALKAAIDPNGADNWAAAALRTVNDEFAAFLQPRTIIGRLAVRRVPVRTRMLRADTAPTASWVAAGEPVPASSAAYSDTDPLDPLRCATIVPLTAELVRNSSVQADRAIAAEAAGAVAAALDAAFIDPASGAIAERRPASVTHIDTGAAQFESSGASLSAIDADLKRMLGALTGANMDLGTAAWIMSPTTAVYLSFLRGSDGVLAYPGMTALGGVLCGLPALTSTAVAASGSPGEQFIALVQADEIELADDGQAELDIAQNAAIQMSNTPGSGAQQLTSLWQNSLIAVMASRWLNWRARRTNAAAVLRSVAY